MTQGGSHSPEGPAPAAFQGDAFEPAPAASVEPLLRCDVAIIGGGITGLSAACHADRSASVAVFEAQSIGIGASGRAFGQVVPYLKHGEAKLASLYGAEPARRVAAVVGRGPDLVFDLIQKHQIRCGAIRTGLLFGAYNRAGLEKLKRTADEAVAAKAPVQMLGAAEARSFIGSDFYPGALLDRRGGHLNPLAYTRGLARVAIAQGVRVFEGAPVESLTRSGGRWLLGCRIGSVSADAVIIAGNAYLKKLWSGLSESVVPVRVHATVTRPLAASALERILPHEQPLTDTRRLYSGVRKLAGRLHITTDGPVLGSGAGYLDGARRRLAELYPWLERPEFEEQWSGLIAITRDLVPHVHELAPGLWAGLGYSGRGIAAATIIGRDLASLARGGSRSALAFPLTPLKPLPSRTISKAAVAATMAAYRVLDRLDASKEAKANRRRPDRAR